MALKYDYQYSEDPEINTMLHPTEDDKIILDYLDDEEKALHSKILHLLHQGLDDQLRDVVDRSSDQVLSIINRTNAENVTVLHDAVRKRLIGCVKVLVAANADVNAKTSFGMTPLHFAAKYGEKTKDTLSDADNEAGVPEDCVADEVIAYLVAYGARLDERDQNGLTPLHYAASRNRLRSVIQLVRDGADIECLDNERMTPLLMAVKNQNIEVTKFLLKSDADCTCSDNRNCNLFHYTCQAPNSLPIQTIYDELEKTLGPDGVLSLLNQMNKRRETPLHWAIMNRSHANAIFLLHKGVDMNVKTSKEETALHLAAHEGDEMLITELIDRGAEVDAVDIDFETPLFKAVAGGHEFAVHMLLDRGADVNHSDMNNQTPLLVAAGAGKDNVCNVLLMNGADILVFNKKWQTALSLAIVGKHHNVVKTLLNSNEGRSLLELEDPQQNTPLHVAVSTGSLKTTNCLIDFGAKLTAKNVFEHTPLHVAAIHGRYGIVLRLLALSPIAVYERDEDGNCAVHLAAKHGFPQVLLRLLEHARQINETNGLGWTPLMCAATHNKLECVKLLLDRGAKVNSRDKSNITPLFAACQQGFTNVVNLLLERGADPTFRVKETHRRYPGWTALDIAVNGHHFDCVRSIIQSSSWEAALSTVTTDHPTYWSTPFRRMIQEMPEAADLVLSRCVVKSDLPKTSRDYTITFNFRYLKDDDIIDKFENELKEASKQECVKKISGVLNEIADTAEELMLGSEHNQMSDSLENKVSRSTPQRNVIPPIELMVKSGREELLHHPLIIALLAYKWARLNILYYVTLVTYALFLALFTSFLLLTEAPYLLKNQTMQSTRELCLELEQTGAKAYRYHIGVPKYGTLILSVISLILELLQLIRSRLRYFTLENVLDASIFVLSFLTTIDTSICMLKTGLREDWQWGCGTVGIFLAWINLLLYVRRGPIFGIFVIMFVSVTVTFAKVFIVFSPFLIAFAMAFHTLLVNQNAFRSIPNSLIKTAAMTIGELDMGDHVFERFSSLESDKQVHYEVLTYVMFIAFLALMCIVMMNLLVGLAVDDIKAVQRKAALKRQEMKIELLLNAEAVLSRFGRLVSTPKQYKYRPNAEHNLVDKTFHQVYAQASKAVKKLEPTVERETTDLETVEKRLEAVQLQTLEIAKLLNKVVDRMNASSNAMPMHFNRVRTDDVASCAGPTNQVPIPVLRSRNAAPIVPQHPLIERLQIDDDIDHEPYHFSR